MDDFFEFYLSEPESLHQATLYTGLAPDEIEHVVGRFANHSWRAGQLKGKVRVYLDGSVEIRASFGDALLWKL